MHMTRPFQKHLIIFRFVGIQRELRPEIGVRSGFGHSRTQKKQVLTICRPLCFVWTIPTAQRATTLWCGFWLQLCCCCNAWEGQQQAAGWRRRTMNQKITSLTLWGSLLLQYLPQKCLFTFTLFLSSAQQGKENSGFRSHTRHYILNGTLHLLFSTSWCLHVLSPSPLQHSCQFPGKLSAAFTLCDRFKQIQCSDYLRCQEVKHSLPKCTAQKPGRCCSARLDFSGPDPGI